MRRFFYALTFATSLWLCPTPAQAGPWGGSAAEELDPTKEEREAERRSERNALIIVGLLALIIGGAAIWQWGTEIREMIPVGRRRALVLLDDEEWDD
jgi:hypothetical protein